MPEHWMYRPLLLKPLLLCKEIRTLLNMTSTVETTSAKSSPAPPGIGGTVQEYLWTWKKRPVKVIYETLGEGTPILLLSALSTVSTRCEMRGLAERLAPEFKVVAVDWPGFGSSECPAVSYQPALYRRFLADFVTDNFTEPVVVMGAGHAAGYIMQLAGQKSPMWSWAVLISPTWRGPLPTAIGEQRWLYRIIKQILWLPVVGQILYFLNTLPPFLSFMYHRHVYGNPRNITRSLLKEKRATTAKAGARFASAAFVTGALDPVTTRGQFLELFQPLPVPVLVAIGEQTPPKSRMEMEMLASFTAVQKCWLPGSLALHEEYPDALADIILPFLKKFLSRHNYPKADE